MAQIVNAPQSVVQSARDGTLWAPVGAIGIALLLAVMALFAFSGAGVSRKLPFLKTAVAIISTIFIVRGLIVVGFITRGSQLILHNILNQHWTPELTHTLFHIAVSIFILH